MVSKKSPMWPPRKKGRSCCNFHWTGWEKKIVSIGNISDRPTSESWDGKINSITPNGILVRSNHRTYFPENSKIGPKNKRINNKRRRNYVELLSTNALPCWATLRKYIAFWLFVSEALSLWSTNLNSRKQLPVVILRLAKRINQQLIRQFGLT